MKKGGTSSATRLNQQSGGLPNWARSACFHRWTYPGVGRVYHRSVVTREPLGTTWKVIQQYVDSDNHDDRLSYCTPVIVRPSASVSDFPSVLIWPTTAGNDDDNTG